MLLENTLATSSLNTSVQHWLYHQRVAFGIAVTYTSAKTLEIC